MVIDARPELRGSLVSVWRVGWEWRGFVPALSHRPVPAPVVRAMVAIALLENAEDLARLISIAFSACLRPAELSRLRVGDVLLLPSQILGREGTFYVAVGEPKMRRFSAHRQHVLVEQLSFTRWLEAALAVTPNHACGLECAW